MPDLRDRLAAALAPRYLVDRELGAGGMGKVYLGRDPSLGREVAIKVLPPEYATAVAVERFLREGRLLARLTHPNIVTILEAQQSDGLLWYVMPRVDGDTLAHRADAGPLAPNDVCRLGLDVLAALEHAHSHGVIHRDIKPTNVFVQGGRGLLADFGIAGVESPQGETLTAAGTLLGTLRYMAPEQLAGGEATERSDIYSLGATLFEAATGRAWDRAAVAAPASGAWHGMSPSLARALRGALHTDPAARWPNAAAFRRALEGKNAPAWRKPAVVGGALVVVVAGIVAASRIMRPAVPPSGRAELVVLRFGGADTVLGDRLAQDMETPLEFSTVSVFPFSRAHGMDLEGGRRVAQYVVTGKTFAHHGAAADDTLELTVYDTTGHEWTRVRVLGDTGDTSGWGRAAADSIMNQLFPERLTEFRELNGITNRGALEEFLAGKALFQRGSWAAAESKYGLAESLEPMFLAASWGKVMAKQWQRESTAEDLEKLAKRQLRGPLGELVGLQLEPDLMRRDTGYKALAGQYRYFAPAREMEANELFGRGPLVGHPLSDGIAAFDSAARDIPELDQPTTYTQTVWGAVRLGDKRLAYDQLRRRKAPPGDRWTGLLWLAVNGRFKRWLAVPVRTFMLLVADSAQIATFSDAVRMGLEFDDPWDQIAIGRILARRAATGRLRASALAGQATALLLLGRPMEALSRLDSGAKLVPRDHGFRLQRAEWRVLLPLLPLAPIALPDSVVDSGRRALRAVAATDSSLWPRAAWALAIDAIARGNRSERDSLLGALRIRGTTSPAVAAMATLANAIAQGTDGNFDSALALSETIHRVTTDFVEPIRGPFVRALVYLYRGDWWLRKADSARAEAEWVWHENNDLRGWPNGEPQEGELDAALSGVARLIRAENLLALDGQKDACRMLDRVAKLWRNAERSLLPLRLRVDSARKKCPR